MQGILGPWLYSLKYYLRICLFLSSPSELPHHAPSVLLSLAAYFIVAVIMLGGQYSLGVIIGYLAVELVMLYLITYLVLNAQKRLQRLLQTLSALIGSSLIVSLVNLPFALMLPDAPEQAAQDEAVMHILRILLFWNLAIISLIFKRAFEVSTLLAGFLALNYFLFYELIVINLFQ
jgi:hypothetical protein